MKRRFAACVALTLLFATFQPVYVLAESTANASSNNRYYYSETVSAGDRGYSRAERVSGDDPHFGWTLGRFEVQGFTSRIEGDTPVFLKNVGDELTLSFVLDMDIDALNGNPAIQIHRDKNGYDEYFGVEQQDFGRGTLIVRHTDFQNASTAPQVYVDYLPALEVGAETTIDVFEEGDYEVALDYEIESPGFIPLNTPVTNRYTNYRIFFRFKVRNSNAMAFLFDSVTGGELYDGMVTPNGFRIDLAQSHYLEINVQRKVMNDTGDEVIEDTRFNRSATDGSVFTDEGIYVVTIKNPATDEQTTKTIYVGDDPVLKASVANQMDVAEVNEQLSQGATVAEDGTLMLPAVDPEVTKGALGDSPGIDSKHSNSQEYTRTTEIPDSPKSSEPTEPPEPHGVLHNLVGVLPIPIVPAAIGVGVGVAALIGFGMGRRKGGGGK